MPAATAIRIGRNGKPADGQVFPTEFCYGKRLPRYCEPTGEYREPKAGEYYLSGAVITGYLAREDMKDSYYWIAKPVKGKYVYPEPVFVRES